MNPETVVFISVLATFLAPYLHKSGGDTVAVSAVKSALLAKQNLSAKLKEKFKPKFQELGLNKNDVKVIEEKINSLSDADKESIYKIADENKDLIEQIKAALATQNSKTANTIIENIEHIDTANFN